MLTSVLSNQNPPFTEISLKLIRIKKLDKLPMPGLPQRVDAETSRRGFEWTVNPVDGEIDKKF